MNISQSEASGVGFLEHTEQVLAIANSIFTLVVIIIGLGWLRPLREKQNAASFTFWSQLRVRLIKIHRHLRANKNCLYYLYSPKVSSQWDAVLAPDPHEFISLKDAVNETVNFLQEANDQMPPYAGWTDDFTKLLEYLTDIIAFDICAPNAKFKYKEKVEYSDLLSLRDKICNLIDSMCKKIKIKQQSIENKLTIAWYKRIWNHLQNFFVDNQN